MRSKMEEELKKAFRDAVLKLRYERGLTQAKMAEALVMSERSYEDIEAGRTSCGALTSVLVLMKIEDKDSFLSDLNEKLENAYSKPKVTV